MTEKYRCPDCFRELDSIYDENWERMAGERAKAEGARMHAEAQVKWLRECIADLRARVAELEGAPPTPKFWGRFER